jgi:ABC-type thiamin/hydroxymethylpyrimidine transport system permease subunit
VADHLTRCNAALLVALEEALAAEAAGVMTPEVGVTLVSYIQAAHGAVQLASEFGVVTP